MAIRAADVVAPVLAAPEIVVLFLSRVAGQTRLRRFFRRLALKGNDLGWIAFGKVSLAWSVTCFATRYLSFPTADVCELSV